jgi:hypothetical protein
VLTPRPDHPAQDETSFAGFVIRAISAGVAFATPTCIVLLLWPV